MSISITITDSIDVISNRINASIATLINGNINKGKSKAQEQVKKLVSAWIIKQPEMQSLISNDLGSLAGQFGIPLGQTTSAYNAIVSSVAESVTTQFTTFSSSNLVGDFSINIQPEGFRNLLNLPFGHVFFSGGDLHWLEWLLLRGDSVIVVNYQYNPKSGAGRSKLGYMTSGSFFRVPPEFSGVADDNFITRALTGQSQERAIADIIENLISGTI